MVKVPHQFQSITEQQWKSGVSRHRCAECSRDYDDPTHSVVPWPLVLVIEDCFYPINAAPLLRGLAGLDDESAAMTIKLWAMDAVTAIDNN